MQISRKEAARICEICVELILPRNSNVYLIQSPVFIHQSGRSFIFLSLDLIPQIWQNKETFESASTGYYIIMRDVSRPGRCVINHGMREINFDAIGACAYVRTSPR